MSTLPVPTGHQLIKALHSFGFDVIRVKGSHHFLRHPDGRCTTVSAHRGETIGRGLLALIPRDYEITPEQLREEL